MPTVRARKLKKLLTSRDTSRILQGVELAVALGDGSVVDELLDFVIYLEEAPASVPVPFRRYESEALARGRIFPPSRWAPSERQRLFSELGLLGLISHAPGKRAMELRSEITTLAIEHDDEKHSPAVLDAWLLSGLSSLRTLRLSVRKAANLGALGALPQLTELVVSRWRGAIEGTLAGLGRAGSLRKLELVGEGLDRLDGLEGARLDRLDVSRLRLRDLGALAHIEVRHLTLGASIPTDLSPIARIETLEILELVGAAPQTSLPSLAGARCRKLTVGGPAPLIVRDLPELVTLRGGASDVVSISGVPRLRVATIHSQLPVTVRAIDAPALEELDLSAGSLSWQSTPHVPSLRRAGIGPLTSDTPVECFADVSELSVSGPLTSLAPIRDLRQLSRLRLHTPNLETLHDMPEVHPTIEEPDTDDIGRALPSLVLDQSARLRSLVGIGRYRRLARVSLAGARTLESLVGIEELGETLRELDLSACSSLRSLAGLERCHALRLLDLRGARVLTDVAALAGLDELRVIAIHATPLQKHQFPASVAWAVTDSWAPAIDRLLRRRPPKSRALRKRRGPVAAELMPAWDEMVSLLRAPRLEQLDAAIERVRASEGSAALLEALLAGTSASSAWLAPGRMLKRIIGDAADAGYAALRMLGEIDAPALDPLRASVTTLVARSPHASAHTDLRWLARFPALASLDGGGATTTHPEGLRHARSLEHLSLLELPAQLDLACLGNATRLRRLHLRRSPPSIQGIGALRELRKLSLDGVRELGDLGSCAELEDLALKLLPGCDLAPLAGLPRLSKVWLTLAPGVDLAPLITLPSLAKLTLRDMDTAQGAVLPSLRGLRRLELAGEGPEELPALPPSLRILRSSVHRLSSLGDLASHASLRALVLERAPRLARLGPLPRTLTRVCARDLAHGVDLRDLASSEVQIAIVEPASGLIDLEPFAGARALVELRVGGTMIHDVSAAQRIPALQRLSISTSATFDPAPLAGHPSLVRLRALAKRLSSRPAFVRELMASDVPFMSFWNIEENVPE